MEITINEKLYNLKYTLRALFIYEQITGKLFSLKTLTDEYVFFYCILAANNPNMEMTFNDLINAMDEEPRLIMQFQNFMQKEIEKQNQFIPSKPDSKKKF